MKTDVKLYARNCGAGLKMVHICGKRACVTCVVNQQAGLVTELYDAEKNRTYHAARYLIGLDVVARAAARAAALWAFDAPRAYSLLSGMLDNVLRALEKARVLDSTQAARVAAEVEKRARVEKRQAEKAGQARRVLEKYDQLQAVLANVNLIAELEKFARYSAFATEYQRLRGPAARMQAGTTQAGHNGALWVTTHSGKLEGMHSISTSCLLNKFCRARMQDKNSICAHYFAEALLQARESTSNHVMENTFALTTGILSPAELPRICDPAFRFESFGDLNNEIQLLNYVLIALYNPNTRFALWTKNSWIVEKVFGTWGVEKPANLRLIYSSPKLNKAENLPCPAFDHTFTVYDAPTIDDEKISINCGGRSCVGCGRCYFADGETQIREKLK